MSSSFVSISLSTEQRESIREFCGRQVFNILLDTDSGVAYPEEVECSFCLVTSRIQGVQFNDEGVCHFCQDVENDISGGEYAQEVRHFYNSNEPMIIAFSGGKDGAASLLMSVEKYGVRPTAVLVDNGFIPNDVIDRAQRFCDKLNVPLLVQKVDLASTFRASLLNYHLNPAPCQLCIRAVFRQIAKYCHENGVRKVIGGHRYAPLSYKLNGFTGREDDASINCLSPLVAARMSEVEQIKWLKASGYEMSDVPGNSTNCLLIGYVEDLFFNRFGYSAHLEEVSREIRGGILSKEEGRSKVRRPNLDLKTKHFVENSLDFYVESSQ